MAVSYIPMNNDKYAEVSVYLNGNNWKFTQRWNSQDQAWFLDIECPSIGVEIYGKKLVGGISLLDYHAHALAGDVYLVDVSGEGGDPTLEDFGSDKRFRVAYNSQSVYMQSLYTAPTSPELHASFSDGFDFGFN